MQRFAVAAVLIGMLGLAGCHGASRTPSPSFHTATAPLFEGMGRHHRTITTRSAQAQRYFDQGLTWAFAFNHDEAIRSFQEVARLDPDCAMAWWGIALCNGPHINNPLVDDAHARAAWDAVQNALRLRSKASPAEQALIDAVARRYAAAPVADRAPLDAAYAAAMAEVWKAHPSDPDVGTLYAEAMMDLQPWDLWTTDGQPKGQTTRIVAVLEEVLRLDADHPGGLHLYIHTMEASPTPEKAVAAADRLRELVPAAGHLVHMPAHIDVQVGQWAQASKANERAIDADRRYRVISPHNGFYEVYMAHNNHFLAFSSMMEGRYAEAIEAARAMIAGVPPEFIRRQPALIDPYMSVATDVLKRFGRWDDVLAEPPPPSQLPITTALWHFARGVAFAGKGDVRAAEGEQSSFRDAAARVPSDALMAINPAHQVLEVAEHFLAGEIAYRRGRIDDAVAQLRQAAAAEDGLRYMEPPEWIQPVRHTLGAVLVGAGRFQEAEQAYREDLVTWPENGWSLYGLATCLRSEGKAAEAAEVEKRFRQAWSRADTRIGSSCLCVASAE
jgi:tetratricopeptide (TPR) repeat protein